MCAGENTSRLILYYAAQRRAVTLPLAQGAHAYSARYQGANENRSDKLNSYFIEVHDSKPPEEINKHFSTALRDGIGTGNNHSASSGPAVPRVPLGSATQGR